MVYSNDVKNIGYRQLNAGGEGMYENYIKRMIDLMFSILCLPIIMLVIVVVFPFVCIDDGLPVFYNADRIGRNGKLFKMYKLRTMKNNSPDIRTEEGDTFNSEDDPRVTQVGKILRKYSIDELPQIFNVIKGDMSIIGPRPDPPDWLEKYTEEEKLFLNSRPGITGYSQAYYRNSVNSREKIQNDLYYTKNCSFFLDCRIFLKTVSSVFRHENIYRK